MEKYSGRLQIGDRQTEPIANELACMGVKGVIVIAEGEPVRAYARNKE